MWKRVFAAVGLCLAHGLLLAADAGNGGLERPPHSGAAPRIVKGTTGPESDFPSVCVVFSTAGDFRCSGTLISPRHVLTAGHCAAMEGGEKFADTDGRVRINGQLFSTSRIVLHPNFNEILLGDEGIVDAAIFELDTPVDGVTPSPLFREPPRVGTPLLLAGFGITSYSGKQKFPPPGSIVSGTTVLERITSTTLEWTFERDESDTAPGDSGGPAFIDVGGVLAVAGITSLGIAPRGRFGRFGTMSIDTRVDTIVPWIDSVVNGTSNNAPRIAAATSAPAITAAPGEPVQFDVAATDPDGDTLAFIWDFGDESAEQGQTPIHSYTFPGTYTAKVTVSDGLQAATSTMTIAVPPLSSDTLVLKKLQLAVNFASDSSDSFSIQGQLLPFPAVQLDGASIKLDVGGAIVSFDLDGRGRARTFEGSISVNPQKGAFSARINRDAFNQFWQDEGIDNISTNSMLVNMPVTVALNGHEFVKQQPLIYKASQGRSGKASNPR